jgi:uncharacterized protein DUF6544
VAVLLIAATPYAVARSYTTLLDATPGRLALGGGSGGCRGDLGPNGAAAPVWGPMGPDLATRHYDLDGIDSSVTYQLDRKGLITSLVFDRWGDPDASGTWGWHHFGVEIFTHRTFGDVLIPGTGRVGWHYGTERWPEGAFFEFAITHAQPLGIEQTAR